MKDIRPALYQFLTGDAAITAIVGSGAAARVYPIKIKDGINQASIVYNRISGGGDYKMQGLTGFAKHRFQIDAWAPTPDGAAALADAIRARIDGYQGVMGSGGSAVTVQGVFLADQREDYDDMVKLSRMSRDYFIDFEEL